MISSKSGSTVETRCHFDHLWDRAGKRPDAFLAVTDPGSQLEQLARERRIQTVAGEPTIGGRYSALSVFGLVPAALAGIDLAPLLARGGDARRLPGCRRESRPRARPRAGSRLGGGRDKVVFENPYGFGLWLEQLLAESTGKDGKGLVPAATESSRRRRSAERRSRARAPDDLGAEFFRFELATAVAGAVLGINPFDQPNVEEAKEQRAILDSGHVLKSGDSHWDCPPSY